MSEEPIPGIAEEPIPEAPEPKRSVRRPARGRDRAGPRTASKARQRRTPAKPRGPTPEEGIRGLIQIPAGLLLMAGQRANSLPLVADGATLLYHGPALAEATIQLAEYDPRIAALLENLVKFGPYGAFLTVAFAITVQGLRNHEAGPPEALESFGAMKPEEIIRKAGMEIDIQVSPNGQGDGSPPADAS